MNKTQHLNAQLIAQMITLTLNDITEMHRQLKLAGNELNQAEKRATAIPSSISAMELDLALQKAETVSRYLHEREEDLALLTDFYNHASSRTPSHVYETTVITSSSPDGRILVLDHCTFLDTQTARMAYTGADYSLVCEGEECVCEIDWNDSEARYTLLHIVSRHRERRVLNYINWTTSPVDVVQYS